MIRVRRMEPEDVEAVSVIEEETFSMPWSRQDFVEMIECENALYFVILKEERIIGSCGVRNILGDGEIMNVVIRENERHQGYGDIMLTELLEEGMRAGIEAFTLEVRAGNDAAIRLYEKLGFLTEGIRRDFYEKPREDALIMWKR